MMIRRSLQSDINIGNRGLSMRKYLLFTAVVLMGVLWGSALIADDEMCVPLGDITLKTLAQEAQRSPVTFPHSLHFNYACQECHHKWDRSKAIENCTTSGCHDLAKAPVDKNGYPSTDTLLNERYFKRAFHDKCIGCHKAIKIKNKQMEASKAALGEKLAPTGPTGCHQCHPKA